jgi:hypothetical protein
MRSAWFRSVAPSLAPIALALVGGGLSYWSAARTPIRHVSSSLNASIESLTALFAVCAAALAVLGALSLLDALNWMPAQTRRYVKLAAGLPLWLLVLPIALSASLLATRISLTAQPGADYWPALWLWLGAMILLLAAFLPRRWWEGLRFRVSRPTWSGILLSEAAVLILVAAVALALRMSKLDAAPFLLNGDEESMGAEALNVTAGKITNMFATAWEGVPTMFFFIDAASFKVFGTGIVAIRMVSALVGAAAVVMTYLLLREMFGRGPALVGALFMAVYDFHLHFSRAGLVNVGDTLVAASALYFAYKASRDHKAIDFAALGIVCGLGLYLYSTARVVTLVVIAYLVYISIFQRGFLRASFGKMVLTVAAFGVAAMPLGAYYLTAPQTFAGRLGAVGLFQSGWYDLQLDLGRSPVSIFWDQALHAFGGFVHYPVTSNVYLYDTPHPLISGLAIVPFIAGFVYAVFHIEKKEYGLLLIALAVPTVVGGILTVPPTAWQRYLATIPAIAGLIAVGLWQLADRLLGWRPSAILPVALVALIFPAAQNIDLYFQGAVNDVRFGAPIRAQTVHYLDPLPKDTRIYWFGAPQVMVGFVSFSLHDRNLIEVFDAAPQTLTPVDSPSPSVYLFMPHREADLPGLVEKCPGGYTRTLSFHGSKVLTVYELFQPNTCVPSLEPPPPNDYFVDSVVVSRLPFAGTISTKAATLQQGEPQPGPPEPGDPMPCGGVNNTAWYSFTPETDMTLVAQAVATSADALVAVYEGGSLASLTPVACSAHLPNKSARVEFTARAGVTYHFQVAALSYGIGTVTFGLAQSSTPGLSPS